MGAERLLPLKKRGVAKSPHRFAPPQQGQPHPRPPTLATIALPLRLFDFKVVVPSCRAHCCPRGDAVQNALWVTKLLCSVSGPYSEDAAHNWPRSRRRTPAQCHGTMLSIDCL